MLTAVNFHVDSAGVPLAATLVHALRQCQSAKIVAQSKARLVWVQSGSTHIEKEYSTTTLVNPVLAEVTKRGASALVNVQGDEGGA